MRLPRCVRALRSNAPAVGRCLDTFLHPHIARSLHGSGHTARVAAWSDVAMSVPPHWLTGCTCLVKPLDHAVTADEECQAAVVAGFIHDTGRHNEHVSSLRLRRRYCAFGVLLRTRFATAIVLRVRRSLRPRRGMSSSAQRLRRRTRQ
jgi:hypothetical protein